MRTALPRSVERVWQALTAGEHTISWLGRLDVDLIAEGCRFGLWHDEDVRSRHTVVQWQPRRLLTLTWEFPGERASRVTFALTGTTASTATLTVHHEDLEDAVSYAAGWHRHLEYLEAHLEGRDLSTEDFWLGYEYLVGLYDEHRIRPDPQT